MAQLTASKSNLDQAKRLLAFARSGYSLLDRKRNVLMRELVLRLSTAKKSALELDAARRELFHNIALANLTTGTEQVLQLASSVSHDSSFTVLRQTVMGVELPRILKGETELRPSFGLFRSNENLDVAFGNALKVKQLLFQTLELECAIRRLATEIRRCSKRADSINKIQIPRYEAEVKSIAQTLEEKDREDLFRLKISKRKLSGAQI